MSTNAEAEYLTLEQGAAYLSISRFTLDEACRDGKCAYYKIGRGRKVKIVDLNAYRESTRQEATAHEPPVILSRVSRRQIQM